MTRILPPTLFALLATLMIAATFVAPWPGLAWPIRVLGVILLLGGLAMSARHAALFERVGTNIKTFDDPDRLVRDGAFSWTRNPMYLGFVLALLGVAVIVGSLVSLLGPLAFLIAADRWYIPFEERRMMAKFGGDYVRYQREVRRWLGASRSVDGDSLTVDEEE